METAQTLRPRLATGKPIAGDADFQLDLGTSGKQTKRTNLCLSECILLTSPKRQVREPEINYKNTHTERQRQGKPNSTNQRTAQSRQHNGTTFKSVR